VEVAELTKFVELTELAELFGVLETERAATVSAELLGFSAMDDEEFVEEFV
jgi:hypothetical protein